MVEYDEPIGSERVVATSCFPRDILSVFQAAWAVSIELLSAAVAPESASSLQYFSANTLYTKVRKHWHQLDPEHRDQLGGVILQVSNMSCGLRQMGQERLLRYLCVQ